MAELIEEQREQLTSLAEPEQIEVSLKDYEKLDNLPRLNGKTIIGDMAVSETVEISSKTNAYISNYTPAELETFWQSRRVLTYGGIAINGRAYDSNAGTFTFSFISGTTTDKVITSHPAFTVNSAKVISFIPTDDFVIPKTINGKKAGGVNGAVNLEPEDILPTPTATGNIIYHDGTKWTAGPITNVIPNGDEVSY